MRFFALLFIVSACSSGPALDAGTPDAGTDAGLHDAGLMPDAGTTDAGMSDAGSVDAGAPDAGWRSLWNGTDFTGWTTWLTGLGRDTDPDNVFTITQLDGEPAIHISGETWGTLTSLDEFGPHELEAEYRWGIAIFPPLNFRDSGLMYLSVRDFGAVNAGGDALSNPIGSGGFMVSMEYQIAPNDVGTIYNLGPISHTNSARTNRTELAEWNRVRIVVRANDVEHWLNDQLVGTATGFTLRWPNEAEVPLARGKLQIQCEGAEIYFRRIRLRPL